VIGTSLPARPVLSFPAAIMAREDGRWLRFKLGWACRRRRGHLARPRRLPRRPRRRPSLGQGGGRGSGQGCRLNRFPRLWPRPRRKIGLGPGQGRVPGRLARRPIVRRRRVKPDCQPVFGCYCRERSYPAGGSCRHHFSLR
jgi:hypothetical protein